MRHRQSGWSAGAGRGASLVAALLVAGTGLSAIAGPVAVATGPAGASSAPSAHTVAPGCGKRPVPGHRATSTVTGDLAQTLRVGSLARSYRLAVPARYRSSVPTPLILLFHGSGSNAVQTSVYTQMPKRASRAGYLVATPDGVDGKWQVSAPGATTDDLEFVSALIADLSGAVLRGPDPDLRRRRTGWARSSPPSWAVPPPTTLPRWGTGGGRIPPPAVHRAGPGDRLPRHRRPHRGLRSGATGAALPGIPVIGVEQNLAHWARLDRCPPRPQLRQVASEVVRRSWIGCAGGSAVVLYSVLGGGHTWPGSPITLSASLLGPTNRQIDATGLMLAFFARHRLVRR